MFAGALKLLFWIGVAAISLGVFAMALGACELAIHVLRGW